MQRLPYEIMQIIYDHADIDTKISMNKVYGNHAFKQRKLNIGYHEEVLRAVNINKLFYLNLQIALDNFFSTH